MTREEKLQNCKNFFSLLVDRLMAAGGYELVGSCNNDNSCYLVPVGTSDQITYHSKPVRSFRLSDHWNWKEPVIEEVLADERIQFCF